MSYPIFNVSIKCSKLLRKNIPASIVNNIQKNGSLVQNKTSNKTLFQPKRNINTPAKTYQKHHSIAKPAVSYNQSDDESDSDDEGERRLRGESAFWRQKMRTVHKILDVNKDGVISFDDFKLLYDRFVALGHLSSKQQKEFYDIIKNLWEKTWGEITPYNLVTVEQYLYDMHNVVNNKQAGIKVHSFLPYLFKAVDKDKSGEISVEEFKLFFQCLGLAPEFAIISFHCIDTNHDGKISKKEFVKLGRDFFLTEDENKVSKMFWGPLAD